MGSRATAPSGEKVIGVVDLDRAGRQSTDRQRRPEPAAGAGKRRSAAATGRSTANPRFEDFFSSRTFDVVVRGYARRQVDVYIRALQTAVTKLRGRVADLEQQASELQAELAEHRNPSYSGLGSRAAKLLRLAEEEAEEVRERGREQARAEHDQIIAAARKQAEQILRTARRDGDQLQSEARKEHVRVERRRVELDERVAHLRYVLDEVGPLRPSRQARTVKRAS